MFQCIVLTAILGLAAASSSKPGVITVNTTHHQLKEISSTYHNNTKKCVYSLNTSLLYTEIKEFNSCLPWHYSEINQCKCGKIPNRILQCSNDQLSVLDCFCITYNQEEDLTEAGSCFYNCNQVQYSDLSDMVYHTLPTNISELNRAMCSKFNREGTLCGSCRENFYPLVHSFNLTCVKCPHGQSNWWKYVVYMLSFHLPYSIL